MTIQFDTQSSNVTMGDMAMSVSSKPSKNIMSPAKSPPQQSTGRVVSFENQPPSLEVWKSPAANLQQESTLLKPSIYTPLIQNSYTENCTAPISQNLFPGNQFSRVSYTAAQRKPQPGSLFGGMADKSSQEGGFLQWPSGNNLTGGTKSNLSAGMNSDLLQPTKNVVVGMQEYASYPQHGRGPQSIKFTGMRDSTPLGIEQQLVPIQTNSLTSMGWSSSIGNVSSTSQGGSNTGWPANMDTSAGLRTEQLRGGQLNTMLGTGKEQSSPMGGVQQNLTGASVKPQRQPDSSKANPFANLSFLS